MKTLEELLDEHTAPARFYDRLEDGAARCWACAHRCLIKPGRRGICGVRFNREGELRAPWGYVAAVQVDPVEKKPFNHLLPGSNALTFGMLGCDFHCDFCQNWVSSQALRDPAARSYGPSIQPASPEGLTAAARRYGADLIVSSYNEPLITAEWAEDVFTTAQAAGLRCAFVSNGNATPEVLRALRPVLTAYKVDLKCMRDRQYRQLGGVLQHVLDTIQTARELGLWVEVVTLVIPGMNDSNEELWDAARFLAGVSRDIPWHVTAFHPDYKHNDAPPTGAETLRRAAEIGQEAGLNYVYAGNLPGRVGSLEDTHCPACGTLLIQRRGYVIQKYNLTAQGSCPKCGAAIPGVWTGQPESVRLNGWGTPRPVRT